MKIKSHISPQKQLLLSLILYLSMIVLMVLMGMFPVTVLYGSIFIGLGFIPFAVSLYWTYNIIEKRLWIKYSGIVTSSEIFNEVNTLETSGYPVERYIPVIGYKYYMRTKMFTSKKLSALDNDFRFDTETEAKAIQQRFLIGKNIGVWVHPKDPSKSIIIQGCSKDKKKSIVGYAVIGCLLFGRGAHILGMSC